MITATKRTDIFRTIPPKNASKIKWHDHILNISKGYGSDLNTSDSLTTNHLAITIWFSDAKPDENTKTANFVLKTTVDSSGNTVTTYGERELVTITVRATSRNRPATATTPAIIAEELIDAFMDRVIEWYICDLNVILPIRSRDKISELKKNDDGSYYKQVNLTVENIRKYTRSIPPIDTIKYTEYISLIGIETTITPEGTEEQIFSLLE